jgi:hypothetical protein
MIEKAGYINRYSRWQGKRKTRPGQGWMCGCLFFAGVLISIYEVVSNFCIIGVFVSRVRSA